MQPSQKKGGLRALRTFAEDLERAQGGTTPAPSVAASTPATLVAPQHITTQAENLQNAILRDTTAHIEKAETTFTAKPSAVAHDPNAFDIKSAGRGDEEGMILNNYQTSRTPVIEQFTSNIKNWWEKNITPLLEETVPTTQMRVDIAPALPSQQETPVPPPQKTTWNLISEPRTPTAPKEKVTEYRAALRTLPPMSVSEQPPKKSFKVMRQVRPAAPPPPPAPPQEDTQARQRLAQLAETKQKEEVQEVRVSRDIPFIPPQLSEEGTAPIRTYRNDALTDIKTNEISAPQIAAIEAERRERTGVSYQAPRQREQRSWIPFIAIALLLITITGGGTYYYLNINTSGQTTVVSGIPGFFKTQTQIPVPLPEDRTALIEKITSLSSATPLGARDFLQVYPTTLKNGSEVAETTSEIMRVLDPRVPGTFIRSLDSTSMFGSYGTNKNAFIVLKTNQFDTALAGMLAWETSISVDLAPFFGEPVRKTFDPASLTEDRTRPASFVDDVIQNHDVRILYDEVGEERILYTFIQNEFILIATSYSTLEALIEELE